MTVYHKFTHSRSRCICNMLVIVVRRDRRKLYAMYVQYTSWLVGVCVICVSDVEHCGHYHRSVRQFRYPAHWHQLHQVVSDNSKLQTSLRWSQCVCIDLTRRTWFIVYHFHRTHISKMVNFDALQFHWSIREPKFIYVHISLHFFVGNSNITYFYRQYNTVQYRSIHVS